MANNVKLTCPRVCMCVTKRWWFLTLGLRFTLFLHTRFRLCCSSSKMCTCSVSLRSEPESSEPLSNKSYSGNKTKHMKKSSNACMHIIVPNGGNHPSACSETPMHTLYITLFQFAPQVYILNFILQIKKREDLIKYYMYMYTMSYCRQQQ